MAWILVTIALVALAALLLRPWLFKSENKDKKLPPGPKGFPIFGSLHLLGKLPHRDLCSLSQKYGPIMHIRLGLLPTIVVSSPRAAQLFLKTHDLVFASRPLLEVSKQMFYNHKSLSLAQYGSYLRNMRKMCTLKLLSNSKINSFESMRKEELGLLIDYFREAAKDRVIVNLSSKLTSLTTDMIHLMVLGKKYADKGIDERGFKAMIQEVMQLVAAPDLGDFFPFIAVLDLQGLTRKMKAVSKVCDGFLERIIDEHLESKDDEKTNDFVDAMLELMDSEETKYQIDRSSIKAIVLDLLATEMDTSATIGWAVSAVMKNSHVLKKMQEELERVVGLDRMVEESDLENLEYFDMVVKEMFRLYPAAPLLIPRESLEDCIVDGFHIPKKSCILINTWAIGRDPSAWIEPNKFIPERFMGSQVDVWGRDFELIPFGSGRRGCPGMQLALTIVRLVLAQLVHCFNWELPNGMLPSELDMTEEFRSTYVRAQDLMVIPIYRLHNP